MPHVYILLILVMALVVVLSWVVPSGEFARYRIQIQVKWLLIQTILVMLKN